MAASLLCLQVWMNTWALWERIPPVALFSSGAALAQGLSFSAKAQGIRELAEGAPPQRADLLVGVRRRAAVAPGGAVVQAHGAYVQAARGGDLSYSFAHFSHMVVRYRGGRLPTFFDRSIYDFAVLRAGSGCPPMDELLKLGPLAVKGRYVAFASSPVTPGLAEALNPERPARAAPELAVED